MIIQICAIAFIMFLTGYYVGRATAIDEILQRLEIATGVNKKWNINLSGTKKRKS